MRRTRILLWLLVALILCGIADAKKPKKAKKMARYYLKHEDTGAPSTACTFPSDDVLNASTGAFTLSFWFKGVFILQKISGSAGWQYYSTTKICTFIGSAKTYYLTGTSTTDDGSWYHLAVTRDSSFAAKLYINGDLETSEQLTSQDLDNTQLFGASGQPNAAFDEVRFYKGVNLSATQVANIYNSGIGVRVKENGFSKIASNGFYASCDDGSGTTVTGRKITSGTWSGHDGTFTSGDLTWVAGGVPLNSIQLTSDFEEHTRYINRTSKRIQFRFQGMEDFEIREFKILEPQILGNR